MPTQKQQTPVFLWVQIVSALVLAITFFLPWVVWDGIMVKGMAMATGDFFKISESKFSVANPLPQLNFLFYVFWLVPLLAFFVVGRGLMKKKTVPFSLMVGSLSLALLTVFCLFSKTLIDLGAGTSLTSMLKPAAYVHGLAALSLVITSHPVKNALWKIFWLLLGPVVAFASFKMAEKYVMGETHQRTDSVKADYTLTAPVLISEFLANDTAANRKYVEKMIEVNGNASAVDILQDSTSTIRFADSTGSYAIFSFEKDELPKVQNIKAGQPVTVKGVCSGSIFSEILGNTSISFKRSTIIKK